MDISCYIITVSDKGYSGQREDKTGEIIGEILRDNGFTVRGRTIVPDEEKHITKALVEACDRLSCSIVITSGGTGVSPRDITPDVTGKLLDYEVPGIAEAMRCCGLQKTPFAMLSRARAGVRGKSLVVNLPGSIKGARESLLAVIDTFEHAVEKIHGSSEECGRE